MHLLSVVQMSSFFPTVGQFEKDSCQRCFETSLHYPICLQRTFIMPAAESSKKRWLARGDELICFVWEPKDAHKRRTRRRGALFTSEGAHGLTRKHTIYTKRADINLCSFCTHAYEAGEKERRFAKLRCFCGKPR
jgi:hypothetical protein